MHNKIPSDKISIADVYEWLGKEKNIVATPHSQRSKAQIKISCKDKKLWNLSTYIKETCDSLQTTVQTIVKREDEQHFANLNGKNLMFVEDACRKLSHTFTNLENIKTYDINVTHYESLHGHDAHAMCTGNNH